MTVLTEFSLQIQESHVTKQHGNTFAKVQAPIPWKSKILSNDAKDDMQ